MPPVRPALKTYSRKPLQHRRNSSVDVFDALLAENICRRKEAANSKPCRRKKPIVIQELPPPDENHHLIEDSVCRSWGLNDTFDKLRKEPVHTNIKPDFVTVGTHSASNSNRIVLTNSVHSPVIHNTRGFKKRLVGSNESSKDDITSNNKKDVSTLDKSVNDSLVIEKIPFFSKPKEVSFLSSTSALKSDGSAPPQMRCAVNENDTDISYEPLFSRTFMEAVGAKLHIASTPAITASTPLKSTLLVNETISPILNLNNSRPKSLIESYEEIQNWNFKPPNFELNDTPKVKRKKQLQPKKLQKKKTVVKNKIVNEKVISAVFTQKIPLRRIYREKPPDWKLQTDAKVVLDNCLDVIGIEKSIKLGNSDEPTLGFSPNQKDDLKNSLAIRSVYEESFKKICVQQNIEFQDTDIQSPVRFITLRKRKVPVVYSKPKTGKTDLGLRKHRQNKLSTNSQELDVNNKLILSKQGRRNSVRSNSNSSDTSSTQKSKLSEYLEGSQSVYDKINDNTANDLPNVSLNPERNLKKESPEVSGHNTVADSVLSSNNGIDKHSNLMENETAGTETSAINDSNRPCSISLQSHTELVVNSNEVENIEESPEDISNNIGSPDVIQSTPHAKIIFNRKKYRKAKAETCIEISTDCSKSQIEIKQQSITNSTNTSNDSTKDTNCSDSQMKDHVNVSANKDNIIMKDKDENCFCETSGNIFTNSKSSLHDEADEISMVKGSIFTESDKNKLSRSFEKYMEDKHLDLKNVYSILEHHNYSKVLTYSEVIEVSSSDEEDTNESKQKNNSSSRSNASGTSSKSNSYNKDKVSEPDNFDSSSKITEVCTSANSNASCSSLRSNCSDKNKIADCSNKSKDSPRYSATELNDYTLANNSDDELDFSEFIVPTKKSLCDVQSEKVCNDTTGPSTQSTNVVATSTVEESKDTFKTPAPLNLKPGKSWRRSLLTVRKSFIEFDPIVCKAASGGICTCAKCRQRNSSKLSRTSRRLSVKIIPVSPYTVLQEGASILENYASVNITYGSNTIQDAVYREKSIGEPLLLRNNSLHETLPAINPSVTARDIVLRRCGQAEPISFTECYPSSLLKNCFKIGEGVYGEVFLFKHPNGGTRVMKVIPIEGAQMVNGEHQKKYEEIISEIVIAMELTNLRNGNKNRTEGFSKVEKIRCVKGRYPKQLVELWEDFEESRGSENDSPEMFTDCQLYIVLELANGGQDMEAFLFNDAIQAYSMFKQIACALAVAESALQFEHRDLHWGNVLISQIDTNAELTYCLNGREFKVPTCGVGVSIIDFTLSRITYEGLCIFNDLSEDPDLFTATGDYQFEIYKMMQKRNNNEWQHFEPYSNVLWLHYVLDKMASALRYKSKKKIHKDCIAEITQLKSRILNYSSVEEVVNKEFLS